MDAPQEVIDWLKSILETHGRNLDPDMVNEYVWPRQIRPLVLQLAHAQIEYYRAHPPQREVDASVSESMKGKGK